MWVAVWVERVRAEISLSVTILSRVSADTLSAKTRRKRSELVPGPPIPLYSPYRAALVSHVETCVLGSLEGGVPAEPVNEAHSASLHFQKEIAVNVTGW